MITIDEQIKCAEREVIFRRAVYAKRIARGQMSKESADTEIERMDAIRKTLTKVRELTRYFAP